MSAYLLERAWVDGAVRDDVRVEIADGRFTSVTADPGNLRLSGVATPDKRRNPRSTGDSCTRLPGLTLPGFANTHSHVFHRALRGRAQRGSGTFWTWREQMYDVAARVDPDSLYTLARATYAEMAAAGWTSVGEFHYLHHAPDGGEYDDPNALSHALVAAAGDVGIRLTLLDTLYLSAGFGAAPAGVQRRFADPSPEAWVERVATLVGERAGTPGLVLGVAAHSVRAVPADALAVLRPFLADGMPLHVHVSEQPAENAECRATYGLSPTALLAENGLLGPRTTAVHATHLDADDVRLLGESTTNVSFCPTTERDLGDGIGGARALHDAGAVLTLGSDSQAVVDPFEEMRTLELHERLASLQRGRFDASTLLHAATTAGHASLGVLDGVLDAAGGDRAAGAGAIAVGQRADLVTIALDSPRTAGTGGDAHTAVFAASAADVTHVVADGRVVFDGDHAGVGRAIATAIDGLLR